jgi:AcrR family transcriptional regulator
MENLKISHRGTRKREAPLTEGGIYAAALRLIDVGGVEALTMRKLATALDANPMSLYHHVPNKDAVLRGVARTVGTQFRTVTLEDAPWQERIRQLARDFRTLAHSHPKLIGYSSSHKAAFIQPEDPFWMALTAILDSAGVPRSGLQHCTALVGAVIIDVLTAELNGASNSNVSSVGENGLNPPDCYGDRVFRLALDAIIMGLEDSPPAANDDFRGADY